MLSIRQGTGEARIRTNLIKASLTRLTQCSSFFKCPKSVAGPGKGAKSTTVFYGLVLANELESTPT